MTLTTFSRQELIDMLADAKADFQHARRIGNTHAMKLATSDMNAIDIELAYSNNITITKIELSC